MFDFFNFVRKRRLNYASEALQAFSEATGIGLVQLQTLQMVAQQVVLSLEGSVRLPGAAKKALALKLDCVTPPALGELLEDLGIPEGNAVAFVAPDSLKAPALRLRMDIAIEASDCVTPSALKLLKALDTESLPPLPRQQPVPGFQLDITGRPPSGNNADLGLSL